MFVRRQYNPIELNKLSGKRARGKERDTKKKRERKKERKKLGWPSLFCYLPFNANCMREMKERIYAQRKWKRIECEKKQLQKRHLVGGSIFLCKVYPFTE